MIKHILRQSPLELPGRPACQKLWSIVSADSSVWRPRRDIQYNLARGFTSSRSPRTGQYDYLQEKRWAAPPKRKPINRLSIIKTDAPTTIMVDLEGEQVAFDNLFLRDACGCHMCVDPSTQQKLFQTSDINFETKPVAQTALPDGSLVIKWDTGPGIGGQHISQYSFDFLRTHANLRWRLRRNFNDRRQVMWDKQLMEQNVLWIDYKDYMEIDEALFEAVRHLSIYGLMFLRGVPENSRNNAIEGIAKRIGNMKETFYGRTWDVKSIPDAKNIAYTPYNLGLHMDLLYFESPPGLQFLHCIRNSVTGGSSLFADAFRAAQALRMSSEHLFRELCDFPVTFHYNNDGHHYHYTRPTVVLEKSTYLREPRIDHMNWSPPFQAPIEANITGSNNSSFRRWLRAIRAISTSIEDPQSQFELRLNEGECVVFNNRRVVHGRREFDPQSGERWLKGTYVDVDAFLSKFRTLSKRFKGGVDNQADYQD